MLVHVLPFPVVAVTTSLTTEQLIAHITSADPPQVLPVLGEPAVTP